MINKTPQKTYTLNNSQFYNNMLNKQRNSIYKIDSCDYAKYYQAKRQKQLYKLLDIIEKTLFATGAIALTYLCIPKGKIFEKLFSTLAKTTSDTESKAYKLYVRLCNFISKEKYEPKANKIEIPEQAIKHLLGIEDEIGTPIKNGAIYGTHDLNEIIRTLLSRRTKISDCSIDNGYVIIKYSNYEDIVSDKKIKICISIKDLTENNELLSQAKKVLHFESDSLEAFEQLFKEDSSLAKKVLDEFSAMNNPDAQKGLENLLNHSNATTCEEEAIKFIDQLDLNKENINKLTEIFNLNKGKNANKKIIEATLKRNRVFLSALNSPTASTIQSLQDFVEEFENSGKLITGIAADKNFCDGFWKITLNDGTEKTVCFNANIGDALNLERLKKLADPEKIYQEDLEKITKNPTKSPLTQLKEYEEDRIGIIQEITADSQNNGIFEIQYSLKSEPNKINKKTVFLAEPLTLENYFNLEKLLNRNQAFAKTSNNEKNPISIKNSTSRLFDRKNILSSNELLENAKKALENGAVIHEENGQTKIIGQYKGIMYEAWVKTKLNGEYEVTSFYPIVSGEETHIESLEKLHKDKILKFFPNLFLGLKTDDIRRFTLFSPFENLTKQEAKNLARRLLSTIYTGIAGTMAISRTNEYFGYNNLVKNNQAVKETGTQRLENRKKLAQELKAK